MTDTEPIPGLEREVTIAESERRPDTPEGEEVFVVDACIRSYTRLTRDGVIPEWELEALKRVRAGYEQ